MRFDSPGLYFILSFLVVICLSLAFAGFSVDSKEMLDVFVPLVWGVFIALGGSLFKLNRTDHLNEAEEIKNERSQGIAFVLAILMMVFLGLATIYPARNFLRTKSDWANDHWTVLSSVYDSLCFSIFVTTGLSSLIVAGMILVRELEKKIK